MATRPTTPRPEWHRTWQLATQLKHSCPSQPNSPAAATQKFRWPSAYDQQKVRGQHGCFAQSSRSWSCTYACVSALAHLQERQMPVWPTVSKHGKWAACPTFCSHACSTYYALNAKRNPSTTPWQFPPNSPTLPSPCSKHYLRRPWVSTTLTAKNASACRLGLAVTTRVGSSLPCWVRDETAANCITQARLTVPFWHYAQVQQLTAALLILCLYYLCFRCPPFIVAGQSFRSLGFPVGIRAGIGQVKVGV